MDRVGTIAREGLKTDIPSFAAGDTLRVLVRVREGDKERLQAFEGTVIAQNNKASAATGKKMALNTSNFLILSTPRYTMNIFSSQNKKKQMAGPIVRPVHLGKTTGRVSSEGIQSLNI